MGFFKKLAKGGTGPLEDSSSKPNYTIMVNAEGALLRGGVWV